jgi:prepilin-type N-terminal cleavage/methylation domain-containing protein
MNARDESGFTLAELLVAIFVFAIISGAFYQVLFAQARGEDTTRNVSQMTDTARLGFNRMIRDAREADSLSNVTFNQTTTANAFTLKVNYNGDGTYTADEILTYSYDPTAHTIGLCQSTSAGVCSGTADTLMANVSPAGANPIFGYSSNRLDWDWDGNGTTTWQEVDAASNSTHGVTGVGNNNGLLDSGEFQYLTTITFSIQVSAGTKNVSIYDVAQLRNKV